MLSHEQISILQVIIGAAIMLFSITRGLRIRAKVPDWLRNKWLAVITLMAFFLLGYLFFIAILAVGLKFPLELVTGTIFMFGAFFVYGVINISRISIEDIRHKGIALEVEVAERGLREKELERYATGLETLDRFCSRTLNQSTGVTDLFFTLLCDAIREMAHADLALLPILDASGRSFSYRAAAGEEARALLDRSLPLGCGGACGLVFSAKNTVAIPNLVAEQRAGLPPFDGAEHLSGLATPLWHAGKVVGGLSVFRRDAPFDRVDCQLMTLFGERASIAYDNLVLLATLEKRVAERTAQLDAQNKLLENIISHIPSHVFWKDLRSGYLGCNPGFARLAGLNAPREIVGRTDADLAWPCEGARSMRAQDSEVMEKGEAVLHRETQGCDAAGNERIFLNSQIPLKVATGQVSGILGIVEDVTERRMAERAVAAERAFLQTIIDGVVEPTVVIGLDYRVLLMNLAARSYLPPDAPAGQEFFCYQVSHHRDSPCDGAEHPCPLQEVQRTGAAATVVHRHSQACGEERCLELQASPLWSENGTLKGIIEAGRDITERLKAEEKLRENQQHLDHLAHHDPLTNLPNRLLLQDRVYQAMTKSRRSHLRIALMFLDLDRFKNINDSLGHETGDQLLCELANRLRSNLRETDTVARMGGDEFVVLIEQIDNPDHISLIARNILERVSRPFQLKNHELFVTASIGIRLYPEDADDIDGLMKSADAAMYRAKGEGRNNYRFYQPEMNAHVRLTGLREAGF